MYTDMEQYRCNSVNIQFVLIITFHRNYYKTEGGSEYQADNPLARTDTIEYIKMT